MNVPVLIIVAALAAAEPQQQSFSGLLCFSEVASEAVAFANRDGGFRLESLLAEELISMNYCIRIADAEALFGYYVYQGSIIGNKQVLGISADPAGKPELFGLNAAPETVFKRKAKF